VLSLDMEPGRLLLAEGAGAEPINVTERNPQTAVDEATEGRGADVVIEAVGNEAAYESATRMVRRGGTVSVVGMYVTEKADIPLGVYWPRALLIIFAGICPVHSSWDRAMDAVRAGRLDPLPIISHPPSPDPAVKGSA